MPLVGVPTFLLYCIRSEDFNLLGFKTSVEFLSQMTGEKLLFLKFILFTGPVCALILNLEKLPTLQLAVYSSFERPR